MFTELIVAVTVIILWFVAMRFYRFRSEIKKEKIEWLAIGIFAIGFGILCYGVRTLFVDFPKIDTFIYRLGTTVHMTSFIFLGYFIYQNYLKNKLLQKILFGLTVILTLPVSYSLAFAPLKRIVKPAPFEPISMQMSNYPWKDNVWRNIFVWYCIGFSILWLWLAFYYSLKNKTEKEAKNGHLLLGIVFLIPLSLTIALMPSIASKPWFKADPKLIWYAQAPNTFILFYIAFSIILIWVAHYFIGKKNQLDVSLHYVLGSIYLLFPAMLCVFVTPIFARLLYVIAGVFFYLAFRHEAKMAERE